MVIFHEPLLLGALILFLLRRALIFFNLNLKEKLNSRRLLVKLVFNF